MNQETLKQYRALKLEIDNINAELSNYYTQDTVKASSLEYPYTAHCVTIRGIGESYGQRIRSLKMRKSRILKQCNDIENFIYNISDSVTRQIFELYYIKGKYRVSWQQVAFRLGEVDESYPRQKHNRYLKKINRTIK